MKPFRFIAFYFQDHSFNSLILQLLSESHKQLLTIDAHDNDNTSANRVIATAHLKTFSHTKNEVVLGYHATERLRLIRVLCHNKTKKIQDYQASQLYPVEPACHQKWNTANQADSTLSSPASPSSQ